MAERPKHIRLIADCGLRIAVLALLMGLGGLYAAAQTPVAAPQAAAGDAQTISLDLKGVDILDVLKLLSQKSGINFVAGRNVTGRVTIFAKDVDVWEAFELIVSANDLAYERRGAIVNVMTAREYELLYGERFQERTKGAVIPLKYAKSSQLATVLNQLKSNLGRVVIDEASNTIILEDMPDRLKEMEDLIVKLDRPTMTKIYSLNYADAEKLKDKIQEYLTPGVGTFSFDARTNKAIISDISETIGRIDQIVHALDEQDGEVLIEAKILRVTLTDSGSLGIDWAKTLGGINAKAQTNFRSLSSVVDGTTVGSALRIVAGDGPTPEFSMIIDALKTYGKVDTVSNPRITVANNQEAKILVGTKEAFVTTTTTVPATGSTVSAPQVQLIDVGTKLYVSPSVKRDGHIKMKIRPEVSSVSETITEIEGTQIPIVSTTEAETNVLVKSGSTIIIGGLIESRVSKTENQVPVLGNLPLVGAAFRKRTDDHRKDELVVFLTPQIISASGEELVDFPADMHVQDVQWLDIPPVAEQTAPAAETPRPAPVPVSYQQQIRTLLTERIAEALRLTGVGDGSLTVSVLIHDDGTLVEPAEITSPQGERFVKAAEAAIDALLPFPPFPADAVARQAGFRLTIDYRQNG